MTRKQRLTVAVCGVVVLAAAGCAPQLDRIEVGIEENRDEISRLQVENRRLLQEMEALAQLLRMDRDMGDESSAMRLATLQQVSVRLDRLMLKLDDNTEYMRGLSARVDLLATRAGIPTLGEYRPPPSGTAAEVLPEEGRVILETAELDRNSGNVQLSRQGFEEFLARYPDAEATDRALYGLGDLAYGEGDHAGALVNFETLLRERPGSGYAASAIYKSRACLMALGRTQEAWEMGGRLLAEHPGSDEAAILQSEIDEQEDQ